LQWEVQVFLHILGHVLDDSRLGDLHNEYVVVFEQISHWLELQKNGALYQGDKAEVEFKVDIGIDFHDERDYKA
jgi:hypothetical protein